MKQSTQREFKATIASRCQSPTPRQGGVYIRTSSIWKKTQTNHYWGRKWKDKAAILQRRFVGMESPWTDAPSTIKYSQHILV